LINKEGLLSPKYFQLPGLDIGVTIGLAFCNRKKELQSLEYNIAETRPTLIVSPRRYGKTSLAMNAILQSRLHYAKFDFLSAVNENDVEKIILQGVGRLIGQIVTGPRKALQLATDLFAGLNIKLSFDTLGLAIEINKKSTDPATSIFNILERIEKLSEKYKKKIVLFFDEFQHVYEVSETQAIESIIRQIAQASTRLVFIFSGSNRHLLHKIFNDRNRTFYKLCDRITLERIHDKDYTPYLQTAALARWKHELVPFPFNSDCLN
jgi:AAA+ ATPase superfamily predicted ATPase